MSKLEGARAVVTGAGSGLGRALCLELARRGARVLATDIDLASAEQTVRDMAPAAAGPGHFARACDVAQRAEVLAMATAADERFGGVDLIVNNAGVAVAGEPGTLSEADWTWIVGVNLWGVVHGCEVFAPKLRAQGRGWVLNVASMAGLVGGPKLGPYCTTKFAVVGLSECLHADLSAHGVGVSVLCPSFFQTNIAASARSADPRTRRLIEKLMARSPLDADDVARIALDGLVRGELHILPHPEGQWFWRLKRALPKQFTELVPKVVRWTEGRFR